MVDFKDHGLSKYYFIMEREEVVTVTKAERKNIFSLYDNDIIWKKAFFSQSFDLRFFLSFLDFLVD